MNKRIEELAVQAGNYVNETYTGPVPATFTGNPEWHKEFDKWTQFSEKFAELIVKECIQLMEARKYADPNDSAEHYVNQGLATGVSLINQHFGVEQ